MKTPTAQLGAGIPQELPQHGGTGTVSCLGVFRAAEAAASVPSLGLRLGQERGGMQPWIRFLEGGASAVSSGSRPPVRALAGHERHPERDRDDRIELEGCGLAG